MNKIVKLNDVVFARAIGFFLDVYHPLFAINIRRVGFIECDAC